MEFIAIIVVAGIGGFAEGLSLGGPGAALLLALSYFFPAMPIATIIGTERLASLSGSLLSSRMFAEKYRVRWNSIGPCALAAFCSAAVGAWLLTLLNTRNGRILVLALFVCMGIRAIVNKDVDKEEYTPFFSPRRERVLTTIAGIFAGLYSGFLGPGAAKLMTVVLVNMFGYDIGTATASGKIVSTSARFSAVTFLAFTGHVAFAFAIPMIIAGLIGSYFGSRYSLKKGKKFLKFVLIGSVTFTAIQLIREFIDALL